MNIPKQILLVSVIILLDQVSKFLARYNFPIYPNRGISLGLGDSRVLSPFFLLINLIFIIGAFFLWQKAKRLGQKMGFLLILSGGISNLLDRLFFGAVLDFIKIGPFPVFNLADMAITTGTVIIIYDFLIGSRKR